MDALEQYYSSLSDFYWFTGSLSLKGYSPATWLINTSALHDNSWVSRKVAKLHWRDEGNLTISTPHDMPSVKYNIVLG